MIFILQGFMLKEDHFTLSNFEGTLDFLICLIRKEEIEIYDVLIQDLIRQFTDPLKNREESFEQGTAFVEAAAYLVWFKSKTLLPSNEQVEEVEEAIEDPQFEIIHHLIDYCRFKQAAKELSSIQEKQQSHYFRGIEAPEWKKPLGIDHVSLEELSQLFKEMIGKAVPSKLLIEEENWRVSDKIRILRCKLQEQPSILFTELFSKGQSRLEMIVIFLALLELMKTGEIAGGREPSTSALWIFAKKQAHTSDKEQET